MRSTILRRVGIAATVLGTLGVVWVIVVWQWQDPFTALYTLYEQHQLATRYNRSFATYAPPVVDAANEEQRIAFEANAYRSSLREGDPVGRLIVPRLGLSKIVVNGTDAAELRKGPGHYIGSYLPGQGQLIYIAGHRTTFSAPFARIDELRPGDPITLEVPYGTFLYRVRAHVIVPADDVARLQTHGREQLALQACHPRFFATQRYIVYAVPVGVVPRVGRPYSIKGGRLLASSLR